MSRKLKKPVKVAACIIAVGIIVAVVAGNTIVPEAQYRQAEQLMQTGEYSQAKVIFEKLGTFKDSVLLAEECQKEGLYTAAEGEMKNGNYQEAKSIFEQLADFKDSSDKQLECEILLQKKEYTVLLDEGKLYDALSVMESIAGSQPVAMQADTDNELNKLARRFYEEGDYETALKVLDMIKDSAAADNSIKADIDRILGEEETERQYQELTELVIRDDESIGRAKELLAQLPEDYEEVETYAELMDTYESYLGTYYGPESLGNAEIRIEDGKVYIEAVSMILEIEPPNLSASYYASENDNAIFTIAAPDTITLIMVNGEGVIYESFLR